MGLKDRNEMKAARMAAKMHPEAELVAKAHNGQIAIEGDWLTICRKGLGRAEHSKGDRRIVLRRITAECAPAKRSPMGTSDSPLPGRPSYAGGLKDATKDENAVIFTKWQHEAFEAIRDAVEAYISGDRPVAPHPADVRRSQTSL